MGVSSYPLGAKQVKQIEQANSIDDLNSNTVIYETPAL